jgi:hypothetical protein
MSPAVVRSVPPAGAYRLTRSRPPGSTSVPRGVVQQVRESFGRDEVDDDVDEREPAPVGRHIADGIADGDPVSPVRQPGLRRDQPRAKVNAVRLDVPAPLGSPLVHRLHEQAVGASDVQEGAVTIDAVDDHLPTGTPLFGRAAES